MISNYNFQPLELRDMDNKIVYAKAAPKETALVTTVDFLNKKPDLSWLAYDYNLQGYMCLITQNFDLQRRLDAKPFAEQFNFVTKNAQF